MAPLWTSAEAAQATGGSAPVPWTAEGVAIDSRTVRRNDLFVALRGPRFDGHDYAAAALAAGAAAAMLDHRPQNLPAGAPVLEVGETLAGLNALGGAARARSRARVVAVTGSVGKTGVKEALRLVLSRQGATEASAGNLNNHWGAPLSLARLPPATDFAVFELGMNHPGEIAPLSRLVRPHVALITTIEQAHTEFFDSLEQVADAKAEIFAGVEPGGAAVLNRDNAQYARLAAAAANAGIDRIVAFGRADGSDVRLLSATQAADGSDVEAAVAGRHLRFRIGIPGPHWVVNSLAVLAGVVALGADVGAAAAALADMRAPAGRGRRLRVATGHGSFELIDESYNASPAAVRMALAVLALAEPGPGGRRIAVLGDMLELGPQAPGQHAALAQEVTGRPIDLVYAAGPQMAHLYRALPSERRGGHAEDSAAIASLIAAVVRPGDVVLVKGSLGMKMSRVVEALTGPAGG